jgi:hypothetical protein
MTEITTDDRYKEYWAYLRHAETLRFAMGSLIVTVASALLAGVYVAPENGFVGDQRPWILVFLALFVGVAACFLVAHKRSYTHYFDELKEMDGRLVDFGKRGPFEALLALVTLPQLAIFFSAFAFPSRWEWVVVAAIGIVSAVLPWAYHLRGR